MHKITLEVDLENNEGTDSPWWMIIDNGAHAIASMIDGPFFSRKEAQEYLDSRRYAYSENAIVYCASGYRSQKYKKACRRASHD